MIISSLFFQRTLTCTSFACCPLPQNQVWEGNWHQGPQWQATCITAHRRTANLPETEGDPSASLCLQVKCVLQQMGSRRDTDMLVSIHTCSFWNPHWHNPSKDTLFPTLITVTLTTALLYIQIDKYSIILYSSFYIIKAHFWFCSWICFSDYLH